MPATIYIHTLAEEFMSMGHMVDVVCSPMHSIKLQSYGVMLIGNLFLLRHLPKNLYELWYAFKVGRAIKHLHKNYDVIHFLETPAPAFFSILFNQNRKTPFMFSTGRPITTNLLWHNQGTSLLTQFLSNLLHAYVFRNADRVMTSSKALRRSIVIACGTNLEKIDVVPFISTIPERFYPQTKDKTLMKSLGINKADKVILCLGEVAPYKNQLSLVKAVVQLIPHYPNIKLLLVGGIDKGYHQVLDALIKSQRLDSHIIFTGYIKNHADLPKYHNLADIFVMVSEAEGNLPQTALDAMCCQKPVIVSNLPQNREWARGAIVYINPYDYVDISLKIKWLLDNADMRQTLGNTGFQNVSKHHALRTIATGILKAYNVSGSV